MLTIRMQRTGRTGHAQFRLVVQDSRFSPSSGRVVAHVGAYNPHSKAVTLDKKKVETYLSNGAQPSPRLVKILKAEGVKLPGWVKGPAQKKRAIKNPEKLRKNRPSSAKAQEGKSAKEAPKSEPAVEAEDGKDAPQAEIAEPSAKSAKGTKVDGATDASELEKEPEEETAEPETENPDKENVQQNGEKPTA